MKLLLVILVFVFTSSVNAGDWTPRAEIYKIYTNSNGMTYVQLTNHQVNHANDENCSSIGYLALPDESINAGAPGSFALLTAALHNGREVSIYIGNCQGSYPRIYHVMAY